MQCTKPVWIQKRGEKGIWVPCSKCMSCRIRRGAEWTMRLQHEQHKFNYRSAFITLTFSDDALDELESKGERWRGKDSLYKEDLQKFFKRLRKSIKREIKYFACGEYGDGKGKRMDRPHYHSIIFGLSISDDSDRIAVREAWPYCDWSVYEIEQGAFGYVTPESLNYVTDYIQKKYMSWDPEKLKSFYGLRLSPFQLQSKGLGKDWAIRNVQSIQDTGKIIYRGKEMALPRYYLNKCEVPEEVRKKNYWLRREKLAEKHGISKINELLDEPFTGKFLSESFKSQLRQQARNLIAKKELDNSKK